MAKRYKIIDLENGDTIHAGGFYKTDNRKALLRELDACVGPAGRFAAVDRQTRAVIAYSRNNL